MRGVGRRVPGRRLAALWAAKAARRLGIPLFSAYVVAVSRAFISVGCVPRGLGRLPSASRGGWRSRGPPSRGCGQETSASCWREAPGAATARGPALACRWIVAIRHACGLWQPH